MKKFFSKFVRCGGYGETQQSAIIRSSNHNNDNPQRQESTEIK